MGKDAVTDPLLQRRLLSPGEAPEDLTVDPAFYLQMTSPHGQNLLMLTPALTRRVSLTSPKRCAHCAWNASHVSRLTDQGIQNLARPFLERACFSGLLQNLSLSGCSRLTDKVGNISTRAPAPYATSLLLWGSWPVWSGAKSNGKCQSTQGPIPCPRHDQN